MLYVNFALGLLIALLTGLAKSSARRLLITSSIALLITYLAFPYAFSVGFLSRETIKPTPAALTPVFTLFLIIPISAILNLIIAHYGKRAAGITAIIASIATLISVNVWAQQAPSLIQIRPINGLMEALTGIIITGVIILINWERKNLRIPLIIISIILGLSSFLWLNSSAGHTFFPNAQGYYKLFTTTDANTEQRVLTEYNDGLEALNAQRESIGLSTLEPLESITGLEGQRIPRTAADEGLRLVQPSSRTYGTIVMFLALGLMLGSGLVLLWRPSLQASNDLSSGLVIALAVCTLAPAFSATDFSFSRLVEGWPFLMNFLDRSWPPNLSALQDVASQMLITLEIALIGTFLAAIFAVPLSFLAARNLTQGNPFMRVVFALTRGFFNLDRGVDTLILALVFVAAVGLGPFAGILAMAIHSIADLGKLYSESIENVDHGPIEALEAVGASGSNVVRWAILPQVAPLFTAWTLYRFEINFRVSIVLGLVGAGGIGFFIQEKMATGAYNQMIIAIIAIVIVVNIIDFASSWLRSKLI